MKLFAITAAFAAIAVSPAGAAEACRVDPRVPQVAADWLAKRSQPPRYIPAAEATCFRQGLMRELGRTLGPVAGYKVGLYSQAARASYGTDKPVVGVLLRKTLYDTGVTLPADYGVVPSWEADLLLVVKDAGINTAKTREEAYRSLRGYRPFIELADRGYPTTAKIDLAQLKATNVGARAGVMGREVPLAQTKQGFDQLAAMTLEAETTGAHTEKRPAVVRENLGDPVEIALAARDLLREEGVTLKAGDLISLGTMWAGAPVRAGDTLTIRYKTGDRLAPVAVTFR